MNINLMTLIYKYICNNFEGHGKLVSREILFLSYEITKCLFTNLIWSCKIDYFYELLQFNCIIPITFFRMFP